MTNLLSTKSVTAFAAAALSIGSIATASAQTAAAPAAPAPRWSFTGLLDGYYQYSFNNPKSQHIPVDNNSAQNSPTLDLGQLDAVYATPATGGFGAHITAITGPTANLVVPFSSGEERRWQSVMQIYATEVSKTGYGVDFGKFYTPFGYEATNDSNLNANYSFSDLYAYMLPFYNAGFRFYTPTILNGWVFKGYVVNALNDTMDEGIHDDNNSKGLLAQASYADPKGKFSFTTNWGFSNDKNVGGLTDDDTTLSDSELVFTPNAKFLLAGEFTYRQDIGSILNPAEPALDLGEVVIPATPESTTQANSIARGYAAFLTINTTALTDWAFRYSYVDSKPAGRPYDLTGTYAIKSKDGKWLTKLEYRYDGVYKPVYFEDASGNAKKSSASTLTVGEVYTF